MQRAPIHPPPLPLHVAENSSFPPEWRSRAPCTLRGKPVQTSPHITTTAPGSALPPQTPGSPPSRAPKARLQAPSLIFKQCPGPWKTIFSPRRSLRAIRPWPPPGRCGQGVLGEKPLQVPALGETRELSFPEQNIHLRDCPHPRGGPDAVPEVLPFAGRWRSCPRPGRHRSCPGTLAKGWFCVFFMTQAIKASGVEAVNSGPWRRGRGRVLVPFLRQVSR